MGTPLLFLADGLGAIVTSMASSLPTATVVQVGGAFDANEVRRRMMQAPAVVVSCLGLGQYSRRSDCWSVSAQWGAYVLTRDDPNGVTRDVSALNLVGDVLRVVSRSTWDQPEVFGVPDPATIDATNLYSGTLDSVAVALWAVTWQQDLRLAMATA